MPDGMQLSTGPLVGRSLVGDQADRPQGGAGFGPLGLLLVAVAMAVALGVWVSRGSPAPASLWSDRAAGDRLLVQLTAARTVLLSCTQQYPSGNNGVGGTPAFPGGIGIDIGLLTCPGAPAARQALWGGAYGLFRQTDVPGYSWSYANDATGVRLIVTAAAAGQVAGLSRVAQKLGSQEAAVDGNARTLTIWIAR